MPAAFDQSIHVLAVLKPTQTRQLGLAKTLFFKICSNFHSEIIVDIEVYRNTIICQRWFTVQNMRPGEPIFTYKRKDGTEISAMCFYDKTMLKLMDLDLVRVTVNGQSSFRNYHGDLTDLAEYIKLYNVSFGKSVSAREFEQAMIDWMQRSD